MRDLLFYILTVVSLYCDDDDYCVIVITTNDITVGGWTIGIPETLRTAAPVGDLWPHQVRDWEYYNDTSKEWQFDPQLTVTGNINGHVFCLNIVITSTVEGAPGYPENLTVKDQTADRANLAGVYRKQGDSRVWKYEDFQLSFNGKY